MIKNMIQLRSSDTTLAFLVIASHSSLLVWKHLKNAELQQAYSHFEQKTVQNVWLEWINNGKFRDFNNNKKSCEIFRNTNNDKNINKYNTDVILQQGCYYTSNANMINPVYREQ